MYSSTIRLSAASIIDIDPDLLFPVLIIVIDFVCSLHFALAFAFAFTLLAFDFNFEFALEFTPSVFHRT